MKAELRSDGLHISGYVNVPGRPSRPLTTPRGRVIEVIEQRAFARALERAGDRMVMLLDHDPKRVLARAVDGTLTLKEDRVGLRAESVVTDPEVIEGARTGRLRGWSFNMLNTKDTVEERTDALPVRHVEDFDMSEVTLVMNRVPAYSSTSIEVRAGSEEGEDVEYRGEFPEAVEFTEPSPDGHGDDPNGDHDNDPEKTAIQEQRTALLSRVKALRES